MQECEDKDCGRTRFPDVWLKALSPSESPTMALLPAGVSLDEVVNEAAAQNDLAKLLIQKWCHGKLSAEELGNQARANVAANRGSIDELLLRLASLNPHNAHRDLVQILSKRHRAVLPPLFYANVPAWDKHRGVAVEMSVPFCLPHEWLHHLSAEGPASWCQAPTEIKEQVAEWKHRVRLSEDGPPVAPLSVWGDTAPFHNVDSVMLLLWGSLSSEHWRRWWICLLAKSQLCQCGCSGIHTMDSIWEIIGWSLRSLVAGVFPSHDHLGNELQNEWRKSRAGQPLRLRGAMLQFRGDWPWLSHVVQVSTHGSTAACFLCRGSMDPEGDVPLTDPSSGAKWRDQILPASVWIQERFRDGFHGIVLDWMHMCDLGVAQACIGNILWEVFLRLGGQISQENPTMTRIMNYLADAAHDMGCPMPFSRLTLGMIRGSDLRPRLKAKAAKTRALVPILLRMLAMHFPPEGDRQLRVYKCLEYLSKAYHELEHWTAGSAGRLEGFVRRHILLYHSLAVGSVRANPRFLCWRWDPKHHMILHLASEQARRMGNPRNWWCYMDEGSIGIAVRIAESSHPSTLAASCLNKYLVLVLVSLC